MSSRARGLGRGAYLEDALGDCSWGGTLEVFGWSSVVSISKRGYQGAAEKDLRHFSEMTPHFGDTSEVSRILSRSCR